MIKANIIVGLLRRMKKRIKSPIFTNNCNIGDFLWSGQNGKKISTEILVTLVGSIIMAAGVALFLLPNQLSSGGVSGIATIFYYLLDIPMGKAIIAINIPLFVFAVYKLGKTMVINSIIGTISLSVFIDFFDKFPALTEDRFLACVYGGILIGIGTALVLKVNSSTGGTDLISQILKKYKNSIRAGMVIAIIDILIIGLNMIFLKEIEIGLYSAIAIYICGKTIDNILHS